MYHKVMVFDAFGTLFQIQNPLRPYAQLRCLLQASGVPVSDAYPHQVMTRSLSLKDVAALHQYHLKESEDVFLHDLLKEELESIVLFEDALDVLKHYLDNEYLVIIGSNLALPYGEVVENLLSPLGSISKWNETAMLRVAFSYEIGELKPSPRFYQKIEDELKLSGNVSKDASFFMVGDKREEDYLAPTRCGWQAWQVKRPLQSLKDSPFFKASE